MLPNSPANKLARTGGTTTFKIYIIFVLYWAAILSYPIVVQFTREKYNTASSNKKLITSNKIQNKNNYVKCVLIN